MALSLTIKSVIELTRLCLVALIFSNEQSCRLHNGLPQENGPDSASSEDVPKEVTYRAVSTIEIGVRNVLRVVAVVVLVVVVGALVKDYVLRQKIELASPKKDLVTSRLEKVIQTG